MTQDRQKAYLTHILESIALLDVHKSMLGRGQHWHAHPTVREATLRTLQVMAESTQPLSDDLKQEI